MKDTSLKKDGYGFYYYDNLPTDIRKADKADFINEEKCYNTKMPYVIYSEHSKKYDCFRCNHPDFYNRVVKEHLEIGNVYVYKNYKY